MITVTTNLDYLIPDVRLRVGDIDGTLFSDNLIRTGLVSSVKYLQHLWGDRYLIYTSGIISSGTIVNVPQGTCDLGYTPNEYDVIRNCYAVFESVPPPILDQDDEQAIVIAAGMLVRRSVIQSSTTAFTNWTTPDLSISNIQSAKMLTEMLKMDKEELDSFFKRRLARPVKSTFPIAAKQELTPFAEVSIIQEETIVIRNE